MHNLHIINYNDFSADELCHYLEDRHYTQIIADMESIQSFLMNLNCVEESEIVEVANVVFRKLYTEVKQLFTKDISSILMQLRKLMNTYVQQPGWSNQLKICCNELYALEQSIQHVLYIKENFLWTKINNPASHEC